MGKKETKEQRLCVKIVSREDWMCGPENSKIYSFLKLSCQELPLLPEVNLICYCLKDMTMKILYLEKIKKLQFASNIHHEKNERLNKKDIFCLFVCLLFYLNPRYDALFKYYLLKFSFSARPSLSVLAILLLTL